MSGSADHQPVMVREVVSLLQPGGRKRLLDATVGLGGHSIALLTAAGPDAQLIGIDLDESNLTDAKQRLAPFAERVRLFKANFADVDAVLEAAGLESADLLLADLGISSSQLDDPRRGLSFQASGPLDMRMDTTSGPTAADLVNGTPEGELADLIYQYGEERYSRRIARTIVAARKSGRIERTEELAKIVAGAYPAPARRSRRGVHPATRTFQALRIAVNAELDSLERLLEKLPKVLAPGGRAGIISFHSLEDRRVKHSFREMSRNHTAELLAAKPITPSAQEIENNPRSRSAKLRGIERIA